MKLSYDGHGINDHGRRVATLNRNIDADKRNTYARLLAAAPELLDACAEALDILTELLPPDEPGDMPHPTIDKLQYALARAPYYE